MCPSSPRWGSLDRLARAAVERTFDPGTALVEEGTPATTFMLIMAWEAEAAARGEAAVVPVE